MKKKSVNISYPCESTVAICDLTEQFMAANDFDVKKYSQTVQMVLFKANLSELYSESNFEDHNDADSYNHKEMLIELIIEIYYKKKTILY